MVCPASAATRLAAPCTRLGSVGRRAGPGARRVWSGASATAWSASSIRMRLQKGADRAGLYAGCSPWPGGVPRRRGRPVPGRAASAPFMAAAGPAARACPRRHGQEPAPLFHPATGEVYRQPVTACTKSVLHGWLTTDLTARLPRPGKPADAAVTQAAWQDGLTAPFALPEPVAPAAPAARVGQSRRPQEYRHGGVAVPARHHVARYPARRQVAEPGRAHPAQPQAPDLAGQHPQSPAEIGTWIEQTAQAWNRQPTPFVWHGKRRQRRRQRRGDTYAVGGSAAHAPQPLSARQSRHHEWHSPRQVTR
jgi:hypothetical protein